LALGTLFLALAAGVLSTLSPCVLPLLPIVSGAATAEHRYGPVALASGLTLSFVAIGLFAATVGFSLGLDAGAFRLVAATLLLVIGAVLLAPALQTRLAAATGPISEWTERRFGGFDAAGLRGQFAVGLLLGAVWSPCVGPTLGAASLLAAEGRDLGQVAAVMTAFGIGTAIPLLAIGLLSRDALTRWRGNLVSAGQRGRMALGAVILAAGGLIVTGLDKRLETLLVEASPAWLTELTTRF
jgi:cytochrome c biogenesis protein CcdA